MILVASLRDRACRRIGNLPWFVSCEKVHELLLLGCHVKQLLIIHTLEYLGLIKYLSSDLLLFASLHLL